MFDDNFMKILLENNNYKKVKRNECLFELVVMNNIDDLNNMKIAFDNIKNTNNINLDSNYIRLVFLHYFNFLIKKRKKELAVEALNSRVEKQNRNRKQSSENNKEIIKIKSKKIKIMSKNRVVQKQNKQINDSSKIYQVLKDVRVINTRVKTKIKQQESFKNVKNDDIIGRKNKFVNNNNNNYKIFVDRERIFNYVNIDDTNKKKNCSINRIDKHSSKHNYNKLKSIGYEIVNINRSKQQKDRNVQKYS